MGHRKSALLNVRHLNGDWIYRKGDYVVSIASVDRNLNSRREGFAGPIYRRSDRSCVCLAVFCRITRQHGQYVSRNAQ